MSSIYISGRMTGDAEFFRKFADAECQLRARGWRTFNPARLDPTMDIRRAMGIDLAAVLASDAVFALPDWQQSDGATVEVKLALRCGIPVYAELEAVPDLFDREM